MPKLHHFPGGIKLAAHKSESLVRGLQQATLPRQLILPLKQHIGEYNKPLVGVGDRVLQGHVIAADSSLICAAVHAPTSGVISAIESFPVAHPSGQADTCIVIDVDGKDEATVPVLPDLQQADAQHIIELICRAGIVGLGGAAFPSHVKLCPPKDQPVEVLIINGCECEPYLTSDHRVMLEMPEMVYEGIRIALKALGITRCVIGIENNKPDAIEVMRKTKPDDLDVTIQPLTVKYPQGAEKMLIKAVMDREVPSGALPSAIGAMVQNVATAANVAAVFETGHPLIERIITVTGRGIKTPGNWKIPFGTKLCDVIDHCGGLTDDAAEIVFGGPMMGLGQANLDVPILKATGGILILSKDECKRQDIMPCIKCGKCLEACPVFLNPQMMGALAKAERYEELVEEAHLNDCMLCGSCSFVCPSNIPLSQWFAMSKTQLRKLPKS